MGGLLALLAPFLSRLHGGNPENQVANADFSPFHLLYLLGLCLLLLLWEMQRQSRDPKMLALLGVLVAINSTLRFMDIAIPIPGGFSPIFFLIILTGYVYGAEFGFLMGALTLLVSALITGGVGPWLPGQMMTAGWVGMSAPLCRIVVNKMKHSGSVVERILLAGFGGLWGLVFGAIMNLWTWPFFIAPSGMSMDVEGGWRSLVASYALFYLTTSLVWDLSRSAGNVLLIWMFGAPVLRALHRLKMRFQFEILTSGALVDDPICNGSETTGVKSNVH